jgi:hypothetical protein
MVLFFVCFAVYVAVCFVYFVPWVADAEEDGRRVVVSPASGQEHACCVMLFLWESSNK